MTISTTSETWQHIKKWAEKEIEQARSELEQWPTPPGLDNLQRGRIAALRALLNLPAGSLRKPAIPETPNY